MYSLLRPSPTFPTNTESQPALKQKPVKKIKGSTKQAELPHDSTISNEISPLKSHDRPSASSMPSMLLKHGVKQESQGSIPKSKKVKVESDVQVSPPRKPTNAFLMFCDQYRLAIQEEYKKVCAPGLKLRVITEK